jgi:hypothetical protein
VGKVSGGASSNPASRSTEHEKQKLQAQTVSIMRPLSSPQGDIPIFLPRAIEAMAPKVRATISKLDLVCAVALALGIGSIATTSAYWLTGSLTPTQHVKASIDCAPEFSLLWSARIADVSEPSADFKASFSADDAPAAPAASAVGAPSPSEIEE